MPTIIIKIHKLALILVAKLKQAQEIRKLVKALAKNIKIKTRMIFITRDYTIK